MELLQAYLISIGIYFVAFLVVTELFAVRIFNNGWMDGIDVDEDENPYFTAFLTCAIPVVRIIFCVTVIIMAFNTKEDFEKWQEDKYK